MFMFFFWNHRYGWGVCQHLNATNQMGNDFFYDLGHQFVGPPRQVTQNWGMGSVEPKVATYVEFAEHLGTKHVGGLAVGTVMDRCCRKIFRFHPSKKWDVEKRSNLVYIYIYLVHFLEMCKCCRPLETTGSVFYWTFFPMEATKKWEVHHLGVDHQVVHSWQQRIERRMIMKKRIGCLLPYSL